MTITSDWHIHSRNSCDSACMTVSELIRRAAEKGIRDFGLTDHIHTPFNLLDLIASRTEFLFCSPSPRFHFGVEVSCVSQWEIDEIATGKYKAPIYGLRSGGPANAPLAVGLTAEDIETYQIEYVIGGTHWLMYVPMERAAVIRDFHRQNIFLATHPLVDIVAHPWWWHGHWQNSEGCYSAEPWFDDFNRIPKSMHQEFATAAIEHDIVVEINLQAMLLNPHYPEHFKQQYLEYLAELKSQKVKLCIGSDCHSAHYEVDFEAACLMLDSIGIKEEDLWRLPPRNT
ncbi:PHP domain-containing protein [Candidatus Poribacteria bacterium]|nr:PHP domain-containing protein [Candidatus Poribacteria bacterium]